jgi:hypothetical protein
MMRMPSRLALVAATLAGLVLASFGGGADAAPGQRPPAGAADPARMVLVPADVGGARVTRQHYYQDTTFRPESAYLRWFASARVGSTRLHWLDSEAEVGTSAAGTSRFLRAVDRLLRTKEARLAVAGSIADHLPAPRSAWTLRSVGARRGLGVGADSSDGLFRFRRGRQGIDAHFAYFRADRVVGVIVLVGEPGRRVPVSVVKRLARVMLGRIGAELRPRSTGAPLISGAAVVGQTLTATRGTWSGSPTGFAYRWQRCDALGLSCTAIAGATGERYVVGVPDVGSRIRVSVSARSAFGSTASVSTPTAVVAESVPPTNVSPPTIAGSPQVGQTLTAQGAGTWTGNPTAFTFRWQRCDAAGGACADIAGATGGTYVLTSADAGSTIRVAVTARNAAGEATAVSAPTAVVT